MRRIKGISLFSGAGGLDVGFKKANVDIVWANDINKDACETYKLNIGNHIRCGDINVLKDELSKYKDINVVFGGPPCQGFSVAGKMNPDDPRSKLIWSFADVVETVKPDIFVLENVKALGLLGKWEYVREELLKRFRSLGYSTNFFIANACDYDTPQSRERVLIIGFKGNSDIIPNLSLMMEPYKKKGKTVKKALSILDKAGEGNNKSTCNAKITLAATPVLRKSPYAGMLFNGMGRPIRLNGYCATLPASMGGNKTPIIDENELYYNAEPWIVEYQKKVIDNIANAKFELAPSFLRRITVEEAAVLQTFPLSYKFYGSQSSKYTQIGNAVPCNLGYAIAQMVTDFLKNKIEIIPINEQETVLTL